MNTYIDSKISSLRGSMGETPLPTVLTAPIRVVLLRLLDSLDASTLKSEGDSETQKSSSRTERAVLDMLQVPVLKPLKTKKGVYSLPAFVGDYFGIKRIVDRPISCRFILPTESGVYAIHQPYGSQANPDILLIDVQDKTIVCQFGIEIKSGGPTWNTHIQFADRSMLYIAIKDKPYYFFGDHVRTKESLLLALVWDEVQRECADYLNTIAKEKGLKNMCVAYPKQEFRGLHLKEGSEARHREIREWLTSSSPQSSIQTEQEPHSHTAE